MTRLEKIAQQSLRIKAAKMYGCKVTSITKVTESYNGAGVEFKNGNSLLIPLPCWIGEMTEQQYIDSRK